MNLQTRLLEGDASVSSPKIPMPPNVLSQLSSGELFSILLCEPALQMIVLRFCNDERANVKAAHPEYTVGDIAKDLGRKWSECDESTKSKYEAMAEKDKARYERVSLVHYKQC